MAARTAVDSSQNRNALNRRQVTAIDCFYASVLGEGHERSLIDQSCMYVSACFAKRSLQADQLRMINLCRTISSVTRSAKRPMHRERFS